MGQIYVLQAHSPTEYSLPNIRARLRTGYAAYKWYKRYSMDRNGKKPQ